MIRTVPREFILGAATAAYQVEGAVREGGRLPSVWDRWLYRAASTFQAERASDSYHHFRQDIHHCAQQHIQALELSFSWTRLLDEEGNPNPAGLLYYDAVIDECVTSGVEPWVALYQFDLPAYLAEQGGWLQPLTTERFLQYAQLCFEHFGDRVHHWLTLKDPVTETVNAYVTGLFPPGEQAGAGKALQALTRKLVAHAQAVNLYLQMGGKGEIGLAHRAESVYPYEDTEADQHAAMLDDAFTNRFLLDLVLTGELQQETRQALLEILQGKPLPCSLTADERQALQRAAGQLDFLGVNYYASHFCTAWHGESVVHHNGSGQRGTTTYALRGISRRLQKTDVPTTDWDWSIFPQGLYDMLMRIHRDYPDKPIYITENGLGCREALEEGTVEDDDRIDYIRQHIAAVLDAMEDGVDVRGYFVWSLVDCMSWTNGYEKRYGLFYVDYADGHRYPKKSVHWYGDFARRRLMLTVSGGLQTSFATQNLSHSHSESGEV